MEKMYRPGAFGALMDEYERAVCEFILLLANVGEEDFDRIADPSTTDEDCRSIRTVTGHVLRAGYAYANYLRREFSITELPLPDAAPAAAAAGDELERMIACTVQTLEGRWQMTDDEICATVIRTRWGQTYDLEQLLEHAIVHVLRHRRQVEKFLQQFKTAAGIAAT